MNLLELSAVRNAVLLQNEFCLSNSTFNDFNIDTKEKQRFINSYQILRLSYEQWIGSLPALNSIEDVIRLKENRKNDIKRLRNVLNEIEQALRSGEKNALKRAEKEIKQAAKALARGNNLAQISRWTTYLSLPIAIIESYYGMLPIAGVTTSFLGTAATLSTDVVYEKRSGWLHVIR